MDKMTRIPVKFRDSLSISSSMKEFIKKCLEVDEKKRMSLSELEDWLSENGMPLQMNNPENRILGIKKEDNMPKLNLSHKPNSQI